MPAMGLCDMSGRLLHVVRCEVGCDFAITEEVVEPRANRKVVHGFSCPFFTILSHQPAVCAAHVTALAMGMLVVSQLRMFAIDEGDAIVWAGFDLLHSRLAHFLEEVLRQGPRSSVGVRGQQQKEQFVHRFRRSIRHLHV